MMRRTWGGHDKDEDKADMITTRSRHLLRIDSESTSHADRPHRTRRFSAATWEESLATCSSRTLTSTHKSCRGMERLHGKLHEYDYIQNVIEYEYDYIEHVMEY